MELTWKLGEERFPYDQGWRTPRAALDGFSLSSNILLPSLATPEGLDLEGVDGVAVLDAHGLSSSFSAYIMGKR